MKSSTHNPKSRSQQGYVLLTLLLFSTLLVISAGVVAANITTQIRRDQEEELIHRATEYRRAVRRFTSKTGRFPMRLEELESTNGVRFLRKRYKDPITGQDFRALHMAELIAAMSTGANASSLQPAPNGNGSSNNGQQSSDGSDAATEPAQASDAAGQGQTNSGIGTPPNSTSQLGSSGSSSSGNTTFGGGVIIGVVSTSTKKTIREFNSKNHYNQWFFFYDPNFDRGFEVRGPTPLVRAPAGLQGPLNSSSQPLQSPGGPQAQPLPQTPPAAAQQ
jgi:type II secretory pathway pseudopilin PulG